MSHPESPTNHFKDDASLADNEASANAEIEQANHLYSQVIKMSREWDSVDVVKAQLIISYAQDAVESFARTNHEKKVELNTIIERAEQVVPPDSIESLKKRAERFVLKIVYPRNRRFRNALLVTVGLFLLISIVGTSLVTIRSLFPSKVEPTAQFTGIHFSFDPPSPVELIGNSIEVKAIVLDKDNQVIDVPVNWRAKEEADYNFIEIAQEGDTVKVTRKPEANGNLSDDLPLIIELIVKTEPASGSVFTDGINVIVRPTHFGVLSKSGVYSQEQRHSSFGPTLAGNIALVNFALDPQIRPSTSPIPRKPIVYLMDTRVSKYVVYSPRTWEIGATNSHDIRTILGDLPIDSRVEPVNPDWHGEDIILAAKPDLIIIHYSCFYGHSNTHDDDLRFEQFLRYIVKSDNQVQFLVYSRAKSIIEKEPSGQQRYLFPLTYERRLGIAGLRYRIHPFYVQPAAGSFTDSGTALSLKGEVKRILGLP
jgi:hypothetical protein